MMAYNKNKLFNLRLLKKAKEWYANRLLSDEQFVTISDKYKADFYSPNWFIKIGLFLFTWISILAAVGLFALVFLDSFRGDTAITLQCILFSGGCVILLEALIKQRRLYRSGTDEALLYAALVFAGCAIGNLFSWFGNTSSTLLSFLLLFLPVLAVAVMRYADAFVAFFLTLSGYVLLFLLILKLGSIAKLIMPFAMMIFSVLIFVLTKRLMQKQSLQYWQSSFVVFECVSLLFFYGSGNYYVIREASLRYFDLHLTRGEDIRLAFFFYSFTAMVPLLYIFYGLKNKNRILLWIGLATATASALTFHYYFPSKQPERVLVVAGVLMMLMAYLLIKYLQAPKHGITFEEDVDENSFLKMNAEALLQARSFGHSAQATQTQAGSKFGGGSSGGGGATGEW